VGGSNRSIDVDQIIDNGIELSDDMLSAATHFNRKTASMVLPDFNDITSLVYMSPIFRSPLFGKTWSPEINSVYISIPQGIDLRAKMAETTVKILEEQTNPLEAYSITDQTTSLGDYNLYQKWQCGNQRFIPEKFWATTKPVASHL
jgi:hypothetical protein